MTAIARTMAPVRRGSRHAGEREGQIWHPMGTNAEANAFKGALIRAAEQLDNETKAPGKQMGALGMSGVKVLKTLCSIICHRTGRLEPSIDYICAKARLARATVVRALARLKEHGFLNWLRRSEPTENEGAGPQVRQISNAYWFGLKDEALELVRRFLGRRPPVAPPQAPKPPPRRASNKAASFASLQAWADHPEARAAMAALTSLQKARAARSASSESGQNPAPEQE